MGDSLQVLRSFPRGAREEIGFALYQAQTGQKHVSAKPLRGLGSGVFEIVCEELGNAYRAVYLVRLAGRVFVLHVFQKKSKSGIATPRLHIELIRRRLRRAMELHQARGERA